MNGGSLKRRDTVAKGPWVWGLCFTWDRTPTQGALCACNKKTPPQKSCPKIARLGPPQAKEEANDKRAAGGEKIESCD